MPDNTLKIGAEVNLLDLNARMAEGSEAVRSAIDKMLVSFQEASTGSARAVSKIAEDTRAGATTVSNEWTRVAQSTLAYNAALKEVSAASYLARKAGEDDTSATLLLASAKQKAAAAELELRQANEALAASIKEAAEAEALAAREAQIIAEATASISAETKAAASTVSAGWIRIAQATQSYKIALDEVSAASLLASKAGVGDAATMNLLAAAKERAVLASNELKVAQEAQASTASASAARTEAVTRAATITISEGWERAARASLAYSAAQKEVQLATSLVAKTGADEAASIIVLASAQEKAALASRELSRAQQAVALSEGEAADGAGLFAGALSHILGPLIGLEVMRRRIDDAANFEVRMHNLSLITGISAQSLAGLHSVVQEMGGDFDAIAVGLSRMEKAQQLASEGNKQAIVGFQRLGISVQELKTLQPEELFYRVARGFNETGSSAEKNAAAIEIFGRGGRALIPVFAELNDQLQEHVQKAGAVSGVTNENISAAQRYKVVMEQLEVVTRSFVANALGPLLGTFNFIGAALEALGAVVIGLLDAIGAFAMTIVHSLVGVAKVANDIATSNFGAVAGDASDAASKIKGEWTGLADDIKNAWKEVTPALLHPFKDLSNLGSLPSVPSTGEGDIPGTGEADTRLSEWKRELQEKRDAEDGFHQLSKTEEAAFWESKLSIAQGDAKLYAQVYHELRQAERDGMKESLKDEIAAVQERVAATKSGSLQRVIILNEEVAYLKTLGAEQTEDFKRLNRELVSATKDYAEEQAKAAVQADRQKIEATRRASDERVAAERVVLEHLKSLGLEGTAEYTAQLRRVTEAELAAHNESVKLQELGIEQEKIRAQSAIEVRRQQVQTEFELHLISSQQRIALLKDLENREYEIQKDALLKKLVLLENDPTISPVQLKQIQNEIENLNREHNNRLGQIDAVSTKDRMKNLDQFFNKMTSGFQQAIAGMLQGQRTFVQGLAQMWNGLLVDWTNMLAKKLMAWAQHEIMVLVMHNTTNKAQTAADAETATEGDQISLFAALKKIARAAATAAAHAFKGVMETVPFPANVVLAPLAAAGAFTAVMAFQSMASARSGMVSENEQMAFIHKNEMVLPAALSMGFQRIISGMSGTGQVATAGAGGHRVWTGDLHVNGVGDPAEVADRVFHQVKTFFRTGGVHRG